METKPIPTAEEFYFKKMQADKTPETPEMWVKFAHEYAVLFAKYHVKEALDYASHYSCKSSILNAYKEDLIK